MQNTLTTQRILSIDALRGITILVMIFVNELSGVSGIPAWMKHMPADADAMTFVDVVFPAFVFIVGMSIPFAINNRLSKGDNFVQLQKHILGRTIGLLVLGIFMVNAEGGYNEQAMGMSIHIWSLLFYAFAILIWNVYSFKQKTIPILLRVIGIAGLLVLAFLYRGGDDGSARLTPHWWGILGLIGWAYLVASILYEVVQGKVIGLIAAIVVLIGYYCLGKLDVTHTSPFLNSLFGQGGHAILSAVALCGVVLSLLFFDERKSKTTQKRFTEALIFTLVLFVIGFFLRPYYQISKIHATPTWALYSAGICCVIFMFLYWLIDLRKINVWTAFFKPAASNPLLTYIIPFIVYAIMRYFNISFPAMFYEGLAGLLWSVAFAVIVMGFVIWLNKLNIKLQL